MAERTQSSAHVQAPPEAVLAVVADLEAYPEWAESVRSVQVLETGRDGRPARARFELRGGPISDTYTLAYTWDVARDGTGRVSWQVAERGSLITGLDGAYTLVQDASSGPPGTPGSSGGSGIPGGSGTQVTYDLAVDVRVPMLGVLRRRAEKAIVSTALTELARRVER